MLSVPEQLQGARRGFLAANTPNSRFLEQNISSIHGDPGEEMGADGTWIDPAQTTHLNGNYSAMRASSSLPPPSAMSAAQKKRVLVPPLSPEATRMPPMHLHPTAAAFGLVSTTLSSDPRLLEREEATAPPLPSRRNSSSYHENSWTTYPSRGKFATHHHYFTADDGNRHSADPFPSPSSSHHQHHAGGPAMDSAERAIVGGEEEEVGVLDAICPRSRVDHFGSDEAYDRRATRALRTLEECRRCLRALDLNAMPKPKGTLAGPERDGFSIAASPRMTTGDVASIVGTSPHLVEVERQREERRLQREKESASRLLYLNSLARDAHLSGDLALQRTIYLTLLKGEGNVGSTSLELGGPLSPCERRLQRLRPAQLNGLALSPSVSAAAAAAADRAGGGGNSAARSRGTTPQSRPPSSVSWLPDSLLSPASLLAAEAAACPPQQSESEHSQRSTRQRRSPPPLPQLSQLSNPCAHALARVLHHTSYEDGDTDRVDGFGADIASPTATYGGGPGIHHSRSASGSNISPIAGGDRRLRSSYRSDDVQSHTLPFLPEESHSASFMVDTAASGNRDDSVFGGSVATPLTQTQMQTQAAATAAAAGGGGILRPSFMVPSLHNSPQGWQAGESRRNVMSRQPHAVEEFLVSPLDSSESRASSHRHRPGRVSRGEEGDGWLAEEMAEARRALDLLSTIRLLRRQTEDMTAHLLHLCGEYGCWEEEEEEVAAPTTDRREGEAVSFFSDLFVTDLARWDIDEAAEHRAGTARQLQDSVRQATQAYSTWTRKKREEKVGLDSTKMKAAGNSGGDDGNDDGGEGARGRRLADYVSQLTGFTRLYTTLFHRQLPPPPPTSHQLQLFSAYQNALTLEQAWRDRRRLDEADKGELRDSPGTVLLSQQERMRAKLRGLQHYRKTYQAAVDSISAAFRFSAPEPSVGKGSSPPPPPSQRSGTFPLFPEPTSTSLLKQGGRRPEDTPATAAAGPAEREDRSCDASALSPPVADGGSDGHEPNLSTDGGTPQAPLRQPLKGDDETGNEEAVECGSTTEDKGGADKEQEGRPTAAAAEGEPSDADEYDSSSYDDSDDGDEDEGEENMADETSESSTEHTDQRGSAEGKLRGRVGDPMPAAAIPKSGMAAPPEELQEGPSDAFPPSIPIDVVASRRRGEARQEGMPRAKRDDSNSAIEGGDALSSITWLTLLKEMLLRQQVPSSSPMSGGGSRDGTSTAAWRSQLREANAAWLRDQRRSTITTAGATTHHERSSPLPFPTSPEELRTNPQLFAAIQAQIRYLLREERRKKRQGATVAAAQISSSCERSNGSDVRSDEGAEDDRDGSGGGGAAAAATAAAAEPSSKGEKLLQEVDALLLHHQQQGREEGTATKTDDQGSRAESPESEVGRQHHSDEHSGKEEEVVKKASKRKKRGFLSRIFFCMR